jgi:hypothetical protein
MSVCAYTNLYVQVNASEGPNALDESRMKIKKYKK